MVGLWNLVGVGELTYILWVEWLRPPNSTVRIDSLHITRWPSERLLRRRATDLVGYVSHDQVVGCCLRPIPLIHLPRPRVRLRPLMEKLAIVSADTGSTSDGGTSAVTI